MNRFHASLENPSTLGFSNLFWFNCFKHAVGYCCNFELVKSEMKSEINIKWYAYRIFLSCHLKYLFSLHTWAYFTFLELILYFIWWLFLIVELQHCCWPRALLWLICSCIQYFPWFFSFLFLKLFCHNYSKWFLWLLVKRAEMLYQQPFFILCLCYYSFAGSWG